MAKDIKTYKAPEVAAATPSNESPKYLLQRLAQDPSPSSMRVGVTRMHFHTDSSRGMYVRLLATYQQEGEGYMRGKLKKAMRGTRETAQHRQTKCTQTVRELGFAIGRASPCHFFHECK